MNDAIEMMRVARSDPAMVAVTFRRAKPGTFDGTTEQHTTPTESTIAGKAVQIRPSVQRYAALGLSLESMPTLQFIPDTYPLRAFTDEMVLPGDTVDWAGRTMTVKDVDPTAPDSYVVTARIAIAA